MTDLEDDWDDMEIGNVRIAEALLDYICPAGQPHTGDDPTADHGHTQCFWIGLAIQRLRECQKHSRDDRGIQSPTAPTTEERRISLPGDTIGWRIDFPSVTDEP